MKKLLILLLTMAMVLTSFTACGGNNNDKPVTDDQTGQVEQSGEDSETDADVEEDAKPEDKDKTETSKPSAPSKDNNSSENNKKDEPSKEPAKEPAKPTAPSGSPSDIIDKIYAKKTVELPLGTTELDLSEAYSLVVVRVKKSKDAAAVADEMLSGINPAKWICVEADDVRVAAYDDLVMLIMVSSSFEETVTGKEIVSAFKKVCGGSLDVSKKR